MNNEQITHFDGYSRFAVESTALQKFLSIFMDETLETANKINQAIDRKICSEIKWHTRKFKTTARAAGAFALMDKCAKLELAARDANWSAITKLHREYLVEMQNSMRWAVQQTVALLPPRKTQSIEQFDFAYD